LGGSFEWIVPVERVRADFERLHAAAEDFKVAMREAFGPFAVAVLRAMSAAIGVLRP
jgi:hypothetical protein